MSELPYARLLPDVVLAALESVGVACTGTILALNSYENRVYQLGTDEGFVVAKFYRPARWSDAAILEEHAFSLELAAREIPVVPPLILRGRSLHEHDGYRFAVFERRGGRWPELATKDERVWMGRFLARIHVVGAARRLVARPTWANDRLGHESGAAITLSVTSERESEGRKVIEKTLLIFRKMNDRKAQYIFTTFGERDKKSGGDCTF